MLRADRPRGRGACEGHSEKRPDLWEENQESPVPAPLRKEGQFHKGILSNAKCQEELTRKSGSVYWILPVGVTDDLGKVVFTGQTQLYMLPSEQGHRHALCSEGGCTWIFLIGTKQPTCLGSNRWLQCRAGGQALVQ